MEREDVLLVAQLLHSMKEATLQLERAYKRGEVDKVEIIKKELLKLQAQIARLL